MRGVDEREQAHVAFRARDWQAAYDAFAGCAGLDGADQDARAEAAWWLGRTDEAIEAYGEAHRLHVEAGAARRGALSAFMLAVHSRLRGDAAQSDGWMGRARAASPPTASAG